MPVDRAEQRGVRNSMEALDALALALVDHGHVWTDNERRLYEDATRRAPAGSGR